jgi:glucose-6-phosphate 1-dehydrogenase
MPVTNQTQPFILTIFGASGDLAATKIFPVLYELVFLKKLPQSFYVVGFARTNMDQKSFRRHVEKSIKTYSNRKTDAVVLKKLLSRVYYVSGEYRKASDFEAYRTFLKKITRGRLTQMPHLAYVSVPPVVFKSIIRNLALSREDAQEDIRLILEKPFGESAASAKDLFHFVSQYFQEDQWYLLDHYLGKSAVRSILHLRHENRLLSQFLRGREIANIQITAFEDFGVKQRAGYFDQVGIVRDMVQSHLLQLFAFVTMSIPVRMDAGSLQREKYGILSAIDCPCDQQNIILGQYKGYKKEPGIAKRSRTETFAALRLFLNREEWYRTPIYIRTGKQLHEKHTYVVIEFKKFDFQAKDEEPNRFIIEFYPGEKVTMTLVNKQEDISRYQQVMTSDSIACDIEGCLLEHSVLLLDVLRKEKIHFLSFSEIIAAWSVIDQATELIDEQRIRPLVYDVGSPGPKAQHRLPGMDGFAWFDIHDV